MPGALPIVGMLASTALSLAMRPKVPSPPKPAPIPKAPVPAPMPVVPQAPTKEQDPTIAPEDVQAAEAEKQRALKRRKTAVLGSLLKDQASVDASNASLGIKTLLGQ